MVLTLNPDSSWGLILTLYSEDHSCGAGETLWRVWRGFKFGLVASKAKALPCHPIPPEILSL